MEEGIIGPLSHTCLEYGFCSTELEHEMLWQPALPGEMAGQTLQDDREPLTDPRGPSHQPHMSLEGSRTWLRSQEARRQEPVCHPLVSQFDH